jgi:putative ABC transport system permease protein
MLSDLKFAIRSLLKTPGFAGVSVLILMLGIGAVTAVFSAVEAVLLRPLPFSRPSELYVVESAATTEAGLFAVPEFCAYRDQNHVWQGLAAITNFNTTLVDHGEAQFVQGIKISGTGFQMLGMRPVLGRLLVPDDDRPGAPQVAVIGAGLWQRSYGGKADVLGRTISVNGETRVIVGVSPADFILPIIGFHNEISVPIQTESDPVRHLHGSLHYLRVIGRLPAAISPAQGTADLQSVLQDLRRRFPAAYAGSGETHVSPLTEGIVGDSRPMLLTLLGVVGGLLLLASTNLAGLHLVRAIGRQREFAVRTALGASRARLIRLVIAESFVLAVVGGACGLVLADWGVHSLLSLIPADLPRGQEIRLNGTIFAFSAAISLAFGLAPGLAPIWLVARSDLRGAMAAGGRGSTGGQRQVRHWLASIQVALALALLACTALFVRSFWAASTQRLGFDASPRVLSLRLSLPTAGYADRAALARHYERLHDRLSRIPGVESVAATSLLPLAAGLATVQFSVTGQPVPREGDIPSANFRAISPDYLATLRVPLLAGRPFTERDDATRPLVVLVGATLANTFFPRHDAIGQRLQIQDTASGFRTAQIVGIVGDVKQGKVEDAPTFDLWLPYRQIDPVAVPWIRLRTYWVLRAGASWPVSEADLRRAIRAEDPGIAIASIHTLDQVAAGAVATRRFTVIIVGFFAATAVVLTIAGIYSVIAFGVAQRTREIGVRLALGAQAEEIFRLILREGWGIVLFGAPLGIAASLVLSQLISAQLYGVSPADPLALGAAVLLISAIAFIAGLIPARRAARVNPIEALRSN